MSHKRGVYHRHKRSLKELFPTNKEAYLCLTFKLNETVLLRMVICNEDLCERGDIWCYASERVKNTPIRAMFTTLNKQEYLLYGAVDRFNSGGFSSYVNVTSARKFVMTIDMLLQEFYAEMEEDIQSSNMIDGYISDAFEAHAPLDNTKFVRFTPAEEQEINNMYQ